MITLSKHSELLNKYGDCPKCKNPYIGNGQGTLVMDEHKFERTCKCGWSFKYEDPDK